MHKSLTMKATTRYVPLALLAALGGGIAAAAETHEATDSGANLQRLYRGTTVCTAPDGKNCGTDYWNLFVQKDGSRVLQVASETARAGEVRHATIVIEADGIAREAFMHNRSMSGALGSAYVVQTDAGVDQAVHATEALKTPTDGIELSSVSSDKSQKERSIGTGPVVADGSHFLNYDIAAAGDQAREVFWMGGSFGGTMAGSFRPTTYTLVGEESIAMPQGYEIPTDHFRMASGSEVWLTKGSRIVVRADVRFGPGPALRYELTELNVTPFGPTQTAKPEAK
ncbi:hypothetical protein [uncultured Parasphingorhabdus sp.]|uniref:hypothetical protein n=1 Tax=uncultured Parasphingorhabdus sp. TaxID=2709694 RepID=UPI002AA7DB3E|nr:hypothetical protein [uncultured Parasphingorhabdus sp.]